MKFASPDFSIPETGLPESEFPVGFPTETVWGLGAPPTRAGWEALIRVKGRDPKQAFQVSCASGELALRLAREPEVLEPLTRFWPGPLTLVVPAQPELADYLARGGWVGLRVPAHPAAQALLQESGGYLLTSSLNLSGQPTARTEAEARALGLARRVIGDGGQPPSGAASTVLRVGEGQLEVLRAGALPLDEIQAQLQGTPLADLSFVSAAAH
ncbi:L-threonylcarbamoyladenylate synthase [Deinococcus sp. Marseille-Q6407]|uniref:L-threonylcarbamoyladenylate synthase n=1 Tax=Deinococcus sp. Marseille-Q6407 TaxID=2969223 RepID=UPI0021BF3DD5|nr:L-threonylcarbamoyladenylate synthase [Deinococcus sp. Marseille-Q6407]